MADTVLIHPNRDKPESRATRLTVIVLLLASAALVLAVMIGGWSHLEGAHLISFSCVVLYVILAVMVWRWKRGVLPVAAALAVLFAIVAGVAVPAWFDRDKTGFTDPSLDPSLLGLMTLIVVPLQLLVLLFAIRGFRQEWNVEVAVSQDRADSYRRGDTSGGELQTV